MNGTLSSNCSTAKEDILSQNKNPTGVTEIETSVAGLTGCYHPVLGFEEMTMVEFFCKSRQGLKQVLVLPEESSVPNRYKNQNVVDYRVPQGSEVSDVVVTEGRVGDVTIVMAQIFYEIGGETLHHDHVVMER